jgi:hypothetical protein
MWEPRCLRTLWAFTACYGISLPLMKYGIIFWGNWSNNRKIFTLEKKIVWIMAGDKPRNSCRGLFKRLEILPLPCEYIFWLMNFSVNNQKHFQSNSAVHCVNTRNRHHHLDQLPTSHVFRKVHTMLASKFSTTYPLVSKVLWMERHNLKKQ